MHPPLTHRLLGADLRALALFRMALGALCLYDIANRALHLTAHYTDAGVLTRITLLRRVPDLPSLHVVGGDWLTQAVLFGIAAGAAVALILGWRTWTAGAVLWVLTVSLHNRNPMVVYGADVLLRSLLLWSLFLPLGARWALDRRRDGAAARAAPTVLCGGTIALLAQVVIVYVFTALLKTGPAWFDGTAIHNALHVDRMARPLAAWWLQHPGWLQTLTPLVRGFELVGPLLLLCPIAPTATRLLGLLAFTGLHLGMGTALDLGLWPWCGVVALIPLLPTAVFDRLSAGQSMADGAEPTSPPPPKEVVHPAVRRCRHPAVSACALIVLAYVLWWNIDGLTDSPLPLPAAARGPGRLLRLDQHWNMFAPQPLTDDGWFVIEGVSSDDTLIDPLTGLEPTFDRPPLQHHRSLNDRWQKYYHNLWQREFAWAFGDYAAWLCRSQQPADGSGPGLDTFDMYYMLETTPAPGTPPQPIEEVLVWQQDCRKENP